MNLLPECLIRKYFINGNNIDFRNIYLLSTFGLMELKLLFGLKPIKITIDN